MQESDVHVMQEDDLYAPPALAEVGGFAEVTRRQGTWGWDDYDECWVWC